MNSAAHPDRALLRLDGVSKRWKDVKVLDGVDLVAQPGAMIWLSGANGVGKTTLLRIACGLLLPEAGSVEVDGYTPQRDGRRFYRRIGFLSAGNGGLYARLTVRQNLEFAASLGLLSGPDKRTAVRSALRRFGIEPLERRRVDRLSMGQRQRVRLAITFLHEPKVILLDEPGTSLDEDGVAVLEQTVREVCARKGAVIWCSPRTADGRLPTTARYSLLDGKLRAS